jgi:flagellar hook-associated protein 2
MKRFAIHGAGAANGSFNLVVTQLASASKVSTKVYAGGAQRGQRRYQYDQVDHHPERQGSRREHSPGATLQQVRENINSQFGTAGFSANILTDASGSRLVITSTKMGEGSEITLGGNSGVDVGYTVVDKPKNAEYTLDGIAMKSKSNDITDAVSGLNIKLVARRRKIPKA